MMKNNEFDMFQQEVKSKWGTTSQYKEYIKNKENINCQNLAIGYPTTLVANFIKYPNMFKKERLVLLPTIELKSISPIKT